MNKADV